MRLVDSRSSPNTGTIEPMRVVPSLAYTCDVALNSSASRLSSDGSSCAHFKAEPVSSANTDSTAVSATRKRP